MTSAASPSQDPPGARPRVLVAGVGNIFLGDDGFGPEVARRLSGAHACDVPSTDLPPGVRVVDYGIRGMHLAYDLLDGWDALVLVDLVPSHGHPGRLSVLEVGAEDLAGGELDAHGMDPAAMLANLDRLGARLPRTILLGCEPESVDEGIGLSAPVAAAVEEALVRVRSVLASVTEDTLARTGGGAA